MPALATLHVDVRTVVGRVLPTLYISAGLVPILTELVLSNVPVHPTPTLAPNLRHITLWASPGLTRPMLLSQFLYLILMLEKIEQITVYNYLEVTAVDCQSISRPRYLETKPGLQRIVIRDDPPVVRQILSMLVVPPHVDATAIANIDGELFDDDHIRSSVLTMLPAETLRPKTLPISGRVDTIRLHMQDDYFTLSATALGRGVHLVPYPQAVQSPHARDRRLFSAMVPLVNQFSDSPVTTLAFRGNFSATTQAIWAAMFSRCSTVENVELEDVRLPGDELSGYTVLSALWMHTPLSQSAGGAVSSVILPHLKSLTLKGLSCSENLFLHIACCLRYRTSGAKRLATLHLELARCWIPQELDKYCQSLTRWAQSIVIEPYSAKSM
ncbi:hypothetical protein GY45DRAFT_1369096 [Cubamyces sp. BRFM 1775]|nr:hypothetical protein GY45DRAFT_1369096 [Cubamyces sp. BRFM 1775]